MDSSNPQVPCLGKKVGQDIISMSAIPMLKSSTQTQGHLRAVAVIGFLDEGCDKA